MIRQSLDADTNTGIPDARSILAQMAGILVPPVATLAGQQAGYAVIDAACRSGGQDLTLLHVVRAATLVVVLSAGLVAWRQWQTVGVEPPGDGGSRGTRIRLNAWIGVGASALFTLVVIAQWLPAFFLSPCQ